MISAKQNFITLGLYLIALLSLVPIQNRFILWFWLGAVLIPLWGITLFFYITRYNLWERRSVPFILILVFILAVGFNSFIETMPLALEFQFILGNIIWGIVVSFAIAASINRFSSDEHLDS